MKITIFGTGYVGLVTGASLANLGHQVLCVDIDTERVVSLEQGEIPFYEPGLKEMVLRNKEKNRLQFSSSISAGLEHGEALFNCVGTPNKHNGAADLSAVNSIISEVARSAQGYKVLVIKSTVPPGTAQQSQKLIHQLNPASAVEVVSNPEFLKQGNAVYDFNHPDKIVVGASSEKAFQLMRKIYHGLIKSYIPFLEMDWATAEMTKYANNSFLATKISFINEIANICELTGADVKLVAKAIGMDYRIGSKFLNAGIGYGGSCFPKDVQALIQTARERGYSADVLQAVHDVNERQKQRFLVPVLQKLRALHGTTVTLWGLSFKPKTSDMRGAPSIPLIQELVRQKITVKAYDPVAFPEAQKIFGTSIIYCNSLEESVKDSDLIILATEWDEFRNVSWAELGALMKHRQIFDGRNIYEPELLKEEGFEYTGVGRR